MKKIIIIGGALLLAASSASAESLTVIHSQTGEGTGANNATSIGIFKQEIIDAAAAAGMELTQITDLKVISAKLEAPEVEEGEEPAEDQYALFNAYDLYDFRAMEGEMFKTQIVKLDFSETVFEGNRLPTGFSQYLYSKEGGFNNFTNLKSCILPDDLTAICGGAFYGCTSLETVNIPEGVTTIPQNCFGDCKMLNLESLPSELRNIYSGAFFNCNALTLSELPETLTHLEDAAFQNTAVSFSVLPAGLTSIPANAFNDSKVTFSEFPEGIKSIGVKAFRNSKVTFSSFPEALESLGESVFVKVSTITEFTIDDVAGLWNKIPNQTFYASPDLARTFTCRAPNPPAAKVDGNPDSYTGVFGQAFAFPNVTFKVLESALPLYQATAPYSTMKLEVLKTSVPTPVSEIDYGFFDEHVVVKEGDVVIFYEINGTEYTDLTDVPETAADGATFNVNFSAAAPKNIYVKEIRYAAAAKAEGLDDDTEGEGEGEEEEVDNDLLYSATSTERENVSIPVTVGPDMRPMQIVIAQSEPGTVGVNSVEVQENVVSRKGDIISLGVAGASLYDVAGRTVASTEGNTLSMEQLPGGVYILRAGNTVVKIVK